VPPDFAEQRRSTARKGSAKQAGRTSEDRLQAEWALARRERRQIQEALAAHSEMIGELSRALRGLRGEVFAREESLYDAVYELSDEIDGMRGSAENDRSGFLRRLRAAVRETVPPDACVAVASRGSQDLLRLHGREAWHFPRERDGAYAVRNRFSARAAIVHLEALRAFGAAYLLLPSGMTPTIDDEHVFRRYLERRYPEVMPDGDLGALFALRGDARAKTAWHSELESILDEFESRFDRDPAILALDPPMDLAKAFPDRAIFSEPTPGTALPFLDASIDVVAVGSESPLFDEGARVAHVALLVLERGTDGEVEVTVDWKLEGKKRVRPSASIVIPSWNGIEHTERCVRALRETLPTGYDVEIVVVDDASTDETRARLARLAADERRLKVLRNRTNMGFLATCNRGADHATGEILVFLNNDTVPIQGWLEPLLGIFRRHPDAGAVAGMLVFPEGTMQEAGGVVFSDGRSANFGKWDEDIDDPLYNYVREVDYGSAALLATPRDLYHELGGFDKRYRPIYCEDTDYCLKVWQAGKRVYYQPESIVIHVEGATSGTDEARGDKRYQVLNRQKLVRRWKERLAMHPPYPNVFDRSTLHDVAVRADVVGNGRRGGGV
jgi:GT2 family glycosyltransferase